VTQGESQVSVGGLLALDQVLRTWVTFDRFWDFDRLVEGEAQGEVDIVVYHPLIREFLCLGFM
jgi:hypothetical protein